ncbi:MAG: ribosome biogenesis/translation initiation ATPase RLI [Candidatus Micrarchaeota archaeon]
MRRGYPVISEILCTGCGICPKKCPTKCITIINLAEEAGKVVHQYGVNTFRMYGMPLPQKKVVGLIGKNGIGKTTALNLLAGNIMPNLGNYSNPPELKEIVENLGKVEGEYFKKLFSKEKKSKIALKPQNVDKISEVFEGKVSELLQKTDGRNAFQEAVRIFELKNVVDKKINEISGGELQRVAIAAAWCKDAEIYYFDEPASYLDIEQRLKVAEALKKLGEERKVIVVEHDLAVFDYLSEYVYVFFGQENAYGIVSGLKNTRSGINQYLQGFLKEENMRFRENEIKFQKTVASERGGVVKFNYPEFQKKLGGFEFSSDGGDMREGEVVGIVGKNAIGKSLFVKMLAGVEGSDNGKKLNVDLKVSYKPQYVKAEPGITVGQLFVRGKLNAQFFEEAHRKLNVASLMDKELTTLSGGELQRVAIILALSQDADIYLLDEPSAFLDVEQRLQFAQLMQRVIENSNKVGLVVDHDLVLVDAISSRVMVFDGQSSVKGHGGAPSHKREGLNKFLKGLDITLRRDVDTFRPRINKPDSQMDRKQKEEGEYYYYDENGD